MVDRDTSKKYEKMFDYFIGSRGVEPKLRFKVQPIEGVTPDDLSLCNIIDRIILGPSVASPLALSAISRMLDRLSYAELKLRLRASTIPFRA